MKQLALWLAICCWGVHYLYGFFDGKALAEVWNISGALGRLALLGLVVFAYRSRAVWLVAGWWAVEELQVVACGLAWLVKPWPTHGGERCSSLVGVPLGLVGLGIATAVIWHVAVNKR